MRNAGRFSLLLITILLLPHAFAQESKPILTVQKDGFPGGHQTPEGVACDLARAFIKKDVSLFKSTCIPPFGGGEHRAMYTAFLAQVTQQIKKEAARTKPSPNELKSIVKVYAARQLSKDGPSSYGYAVLGLKQVEFVDVVVLLRKDQQFTNRTLVLQTADGKWYVHPLPVSAPLLSDGLNQEAASTEDFTEAYTIKK